MNPTTRLQVINWLAGRGSSGTAENDLVRGFCEALRRGLNLSKAPASSIRWTRYSRPWLSLSDTDQ